VARSVLSLVAVGALYWASTAACSPALVPAPPETEPPAGGLDALVAAAPGSRWHYRVTRQGGELSVEASIAKGGSARLGVDDPAGEFIRGLEVADGTGWKAVDGLRVPACRERCRLRYRFDLAGAADGIGDTEVADRHAETILSPPSAWLLRPNDEEAMLTFSVDDASFVTGMWPSEEAAGAYVGDASMFWRAPYSAFGTFRRKTLHVGESEVELAFAAPPDGVAPPDEARATRWLENAAEAVATYFGAFPVPRVMLIVLPTDGRRVNGKEMGGGGASILLYLGSDASEAKLANDWVAVHEMVHLAVPLMPMRFGWLTEGLATYVEPLARAQVGRQDVETVWRDMLDGMPNGQPGPGDQGLDRTPTWGRTYWGGALFALYADVAIRKETGGAHSLQTALRAVLAQGGHNGVMWSIDRFLTAADEATSTRVLRELYAAWSHTAVRVDLEALWAELGVRREGGAIRFDDSAPHAAIRRALTEKP
jgi:hypothetical protein